MSSRPACFPSAPSHPQPASVARPAETAETPAAPLSSRVPVLRHRASGLAFDQDAVIEEVPVALVFNGVSHAVMLATPGDLPDLALGFALGEGILHHPAELYDLEVMPGCDGWTLEMRISAQRFAALKERRRSLAGRTGCGLCGVESLAAVHRMPARPAPPAAPPTGPSAQALARAQQQLRPLQVLHHQTGGAHAAAWISPEGQVLALREDVGRHNALDKLIGALARAGTPLHEGFVLVTSRASYEMVQKVACAGGHTLVAVSAPTALAVRQAEAAGMLLIGFARDGHWTAYTRIDRVSARAQAPDTDT